MQGLRLSKTTDSSTTRYAYNNGGKVIAELNGTNQAIANYIWGPDRLLAKKEAVTGKNYLYLYNGHGDVVQIIDPTGQVVNKYQYDEWGNILSEQEQIQNSFKYAGEILDDETGYYYLRARYYDPTDGRFISKDTHEGQIVNPLSLNLYTYVENNPLTFVDPTGNAPFMFDNKGGSGLRPSGLGGGERGGSSGGGGGRSGSYRVSSVVRTAGSSTSYSKISNDPFLQKLQKVYNLSTGKVSNTNPSKAIVTYNPQFAAQQMLKNAKIPTRNLEGMVPKGTPNTFKPSPTIEEGFKYNYKINDTKVEIKWHSPDAEAALKYPNSNSGNGWTAQIKIGNRLLRQDGMFQKKADNITHIPVEF
jgi:RHS repeat-associated protein